MEEETESAWYPGITEKHFELAIQDAVRTEREACAKVAEKFNFNDRAEIEPPRTMPKYVAQAIRTRSNAEITGRTLAQNEAEDA